MRLSKTYACERKTYAQWRKDFLICCQDVRYLEHGSNVKLDVFCLIWFKPLKCCLIFFGRICPWIFLELLHRFRGWMLWNIPSKRWFSEVTGGPMGCLHTYIYIYTHTRYVCVYTVTWTGNRKHWPISCVNLDMYFWYLNRLLISWGYLRTGKNTRNWGYLQFYLLSNRISRYIYIYIYSKSTIGYVYEASGICTSHWGYLRTLHYLSTIAVEYSRSTQDMNCKQLLAIVY